MYVRTIYYVYINIAMRMVEAFSGRCHKYTFLTLHFVNLILLDLSRFP